ncbi:MAG: ABC transporter ATP-binding protein [Actinobacteria bacterium]|nr:ABC transporter ATP-binding protein [Actinomycetota bacterium]
MPEPAVEVRGLTVVRGGRPVLAGLDCTVTAGTVTGLLGPSGSGKTTLMRCVVGVQRISAGAVIVLGQPAGTASLRARVGYVTQAPSVYADLSVRDNLRYLSALVGAARNRIDQVLEQVGLTAHAGTLVRNLSGGECSRASLAGALVGDPTLLVLDEPTVGLDPVLRRDLWALFTDLAEQGTTLLVSSHVMDEARRCHRLLLLREGRLIADDTPDAIRVRAGTDDLDEAFLRLIEATPTEPAVAAPASPGPDPEVTRR